MTGTACARAIALDALIDYWADRGATDEALEEHVFECAACTARLAWLAALAAAMPAAVERRGGRALLLTGDAAEHLERRGVRMRHYRCPPNASVACTVAPDDDLVVSWIPVDVADDETLDGVLLAPDDRELFRFDDGAVDRGRGELIIAHAAEALLSLPDSALRLRLSATGPRGRRELGECLFNHSAPRSSVP